MVLPSVVCSSPKGCSRLLTLFWPSLFWCIRDLGGRAHCAPPPLNIFGFGWVRVPILFGNDLLRNDLPYSKGFIKFGCPEPSKKCLPLETFVCQRGVDPVSIGPPYEILVFPTNFNFFQGNEITLRGKKCTALFQTHN